VKCRHRLLDLFQRRDGAIQLRCGQCDAIQSIGAANDSPEAQDEIVAAMVADVIASDYCDDYIARSLAAEEVDDTEAAIDWEDFWMGWDGDDSWSPTCPSDYATGALARAIYDHDRT
jgi:hypothetical protein